MLLPLQISPLLYWGLAPAFFRQGRVVSLFFLMKTQYAGQCISQHIHVNGLCNVGGHSRVQRRLYILGKGKMCIRDRDKVVGYLDEIENLFCIGRNGQHRYNNMDHSMLTAMEAVKNIRAGVSSKDNVWNVNTEKEYHCLLYTSRCV